VTIRSQLVSRGAKIRGVGQSFVVENAGCSSCAERVRAVVEPLVAVRSVEIDEESDTAILTVAAAPRLAEQAVNAALADASAGSGHQYRVQPGSWRSG
jgi:copper chaperone CopZ